MPRRPHIGKGNYICVNCHEQIRENKGETMMNAEEFIWEDEKGRLHTYHTKKHANLEQCRRLKV